MKLYRLQYVAADGLAHEYVDGIEVIMGLASAALLTQSTAAVVVEDHKTAVEAELDAMENQVQMIGLIRGGYQPQ